MFIILLALTVVIAAELGSRDSNKRTNNYSSQEIKNCECGSIDDIYKRLYGMSRKEYVHRQNSLYGTEAFTEWCRRNACR